MVACLVFDNKIISVCKTTYKCVALIGQRLFALAGTIYHGSQQKLCLRGQSLRIRLE